MSVVKSNDNLIHQQVVEKQILNTQ